MNTLSLTARLISAAAAVAVTLALLGTVFAIAEPQRSVLIAKLQHSEQVQPSASVALAMVSTLGARVGQ